jgi:hypothetical protein
MNTSSTLNTNSVIQNITNTKGRFFGLYLTNGEVLNAQYRSQTASYITVFDRSRRTVRKLRKTSVARATV